MKTNYIQIQTTFENAGDAKKMVSLMLDAKLVACGQVGEIESLYNWDGKSCKNKEFLLTMKTRTELYENCEKFIKANHPYKVPQIIAVPIVNGSQDYLDWVCENTVGAGVPTARNKDAKE